MKNELINRGVPVDKIYEDFAGFRTLDSVVRAKEIFGQNSYIIISQKFHNERAVYLAQKNGIEAFGFNAKDVNKYAGIKTKIREYLARTKVFVDFVIGKEPKFGGEKINPALEVIKLLPKKIGENEIKILEIPTVYKKSIEKIDKEIENFILTTCFFIG